MRKIRFLKQMTASILSNNRIVPPFGVNGNGPGACGHNLVIRTDGHTEELGYVASVEMQPEDVFIVETPGGGGYGKAE